MIFKAPPNPNRSVILYSPLKDESIHAIVQPSKEHNWEIISMPDIHGILYNFKGFKEKASHMQHLRQRREGGKSHV